MFTSTVTTVGTLCMRLSCDNLGTFKTFNNDTTLDLDVVASPSKLLESDKDEAKYISDMDALLFFMIAPADTRKSQFRVGVLMTGPRND